MICTCYFKLCQKINLTCLTARENTYNTLEISLVVFIPNITTDHAFDLSRKYHNIPQCSLLVTPKFCRIIVFSFSWELNGPKKKLKLMLIHNFWVTNKEHYGMLWYFLQWSITYTYFRMKSIFNRRAYINYNLGVGHDFNKASKQAKRFKINKIHTHYKVFYTFMQIK